MKLSQYSNLDSAAAFKKLKNYKQPSLKELLNPKRIAESIIPAGGGLAFSYAGAPVDENILSLFQDLAEEQKLLEQYRSLLEGEIMNPGENRRVLHHLCRRDTGKAVTEGDTKFRDFYKGELRKIRDFSGKVHSGEIKGSTGKPFTAAIQIGIGGSDLGPRALSLALENYAAVRGLQRLAPHFISNVDPDDAFTVLKGLDPETTLFILVSKSGTTQETLANYQLVKSWALGKGIKNFKLEKQMLAVTSKESPLASSSDFLTSFYIDDYIGGRYSSTSAVGGVIISLAYGFDIFEELLAGAAESDQTALREKVGENAALLDACIGVYYRNILSYSNLAILPYSNALRRFAAHLQQLDMESNGKQVNRRGEFIGYKTGPIIFGEPGTNGQHSFYQHLHQGTDIVPLEFILFEESQSGQDYSLGGSTNQIKLRANCAAQIAAFTWGRENPDANKFFPGERPCTLLFGKELNPRALGALLAHFENKVMFQGFLWNINSFDQEGVQLGKVLTETLLKRKNLDPVLEGYGKLLGLL